MRNIWWVPGTSLILFGLAIFVFPRLLEFIVAAAFISIGLGLLTWGRTMRQAMSNQSGMYRVYTNQSMNDTHYS